MNEHTVAVVGKGALAVLLLLLAALLVGHRHGSTGHGGSRAARAQASAVPAGVPTPPSAAARPVARAVATPAAGPAHRPPVQARRAHLAAATALALVPALLGVCALCAAMRGARRLWSRWAHPSRLLAPLAAVLALACGSLTPPAAARAAQSPTAYLTGAIDWLQANYLFSYQHDWPALRRQALTLARGARTTADTYWAIAYVLFQIGDDGTFLNMPDPAPGLVPSGFWAQYPGGRVFYVYPGSPADRAGIRQGDQVRSIDGRPVHPAPFSPYVAQPRGPAMQVVLRRAGTARPIAVDLTIDASGGYQTTSSGHLLRVGSRTIAYLNPGGANGQLPYPAQFQRLIRTMDQAGACGWVVDLQQTASGDLWSYLAGLGPLLDPGVHGGFYYPTNGTTWAWSYRAGRVFFNGQERPEDGLGAPPYILRRPEPPIAVLTSGATLSAAELLAGAFAGHPHTRSFGQPTVGSPNEETSTELSDGAYLVTSNAEGTDARGNLYSGPLVPDVLIATTWTSPGTLGDPVLRAAVHWLTAQRACSR